MVADFIVKRMSEEDANWAFENSLYIGTNDYYAGIHGAERRARRETAIANAKNFLQKSNLSPEMIADCCSLSLEQVLELQKELEAAPIESK